MRMRIFIIACLIVLAYVVGDLVKAWTEPTTVVIEKKEMEISKDCWK